MANSHSISSRKFCCFSCIIAMVNQNSPTVEFCQEKIEANLRRANTERSVVFRKANTEPSMHFRRANTETYQKQNVILSSCVHFKANKKLCLQFTLKCTQLKENKELFPLNLTHNSMKTRHTEKYVVYHANTQRLKNSTVPYLQKILDDNEISKLTKDSPVYCQFSHCRCQFLLHPDFSLCCYMTPYKPSLFFFFFLILSKRVGKERVFLRLAGLLLEISLGLQPREIFGAALPA